MSNRKLSDRKQAFLGDGRADHYNRIVRRLRDAFFSCGVVAVFAVWPNACRARELTAAEARSIAREAYIYGFPIVENYKMMYAFAIDKQGKDFEAPLNTLKHRDRVFTPADTAVLTPNVDTPYSFLWMDLRVEPLVLGVPKVEGGRYYSIQLIDLYGYTFDYIGSRATGNGAGRYLIAGPNWMGEAPAKVSKVIRCETQFAMAVYRTQLRSPDDLDNVNNIQAQYTAQTLSEFSGLPSPKPAAAMEFPAPESASETGLAFYSTLGFLLKFCPPPTSEKELMARFGRIGVSANSPFDATDLSPDIQAALNSGMEEGDAAITAAASKLKVTEVVGTRDYLGNDYIKRAVAAKLGRFSNSKEEALYPLYLTDAEGKPLDANIASYVLKFGKNDLPPVNAFWSITMYGGKSERLVPNPIHRYRIGSSMISSLVPDADGGLTIHIQHAAPAQERLANWLPAPKGPFYLVMRLYWPKPEAYNGAWTPPLVWRANAEQTSPASKPAGAEAAEEIKPSALAGEPNPEMERPTIWGEPTEVRIAIYVIDVDDVNSADQSFSASIYYVAQWKNPLLRHKGPGPKYLAITEVWNPHLTIVGQQMAWKSFPESVEIQPDGTVIQRQKVWGRFSQPLTLRNFPFDKQELSIHIVAAGLLEGQVKIVPLVLENGRASGVAKKFSLPDFDVVSWSASPQPYYPVEGEIGVAGYEMKIRIARQTTYYILKVIMPLCLIVVMSWLPRWIDPQQTGTNIGISTSSFLTLVAYLFAITVLLPRVSYITRMDRFILLSTLTVFAGLLQTVVNTVLLKKQKKPWVERIDHRSRVIYVVLFLLVLVVSFVF